jgi:hypothetical protein
MEIRDEWFPLIVTLMRNLMSTSTTNLLSSPYGKAEGKKGKVIQTQPQNSFLWN